MQYRNEINGLRAIAVMSVVLFHLGFSFLPGGFLGVDIFFVISGYLITSIILFDKKHNQFSVLTFYLKRLRRILPALYAMLVFSTVLAYLTLSPNDGRDYYQSLVATILFNSNTLFYLEHSNYFGLTAEYKPLLHTWSLGVEEQFYLFYPLLLLALFALKTPKAVLLWVAALGLLSFAVMLWGYSYDASAAFYLLPARSWELLLGGAVALCLYLRGGNTFTSSVAQYGSLFGFLLIIYTITLYDLSVHSIGFFLLVSTAGTALLILFISPRTLIGKLLCNKTFVFIGLISYSLYLWHQPIIAFYRYFVLRPLTQQDAILVLFGMFVAGVLSWRFIEQPFRDKLKISQPLFMTLLCAFSVGLVFVGIQGHLSWGFKDSKLTKIPAERRYIYVDHEMEAKRKADMAGLVEIKNESKQAFPKILILGDSVSHDLWLAVRSEADLFPKYQFRNFSLDDIEMKAFLDYLSNEKKAVKQSRETYENLKLQIQNADKIVLAAGWTKQTASTGLDLAKYLAKGKAVYIVDAFRVFNMAESSFYFANASTALELNPNYMYERLLPEQVSIRKYFLSNIGADSNIKYIDKFRFFCSHLDKTCNFYNADKRPLIHDEIHLTVEGELHYAKSLAASGYFQ
jgi:peptidoglycan/LPS O-acetylase OafA/YrhL